VDGAAGAAGKVAAAGTLPPCNGPCPPPASGVRGTYVLVEMDGAPLPHTSRYRDPQTPERTCTGIVESDTLTLWDDGTFQQRGTGRNWCNDMPAPDRSTVDSLRGTFALHGPRGDSIAMEITALDPPVEMSGVFRGGELRLVDQSHTETPRSSFRYLRRRD
jgi:hypothetical protein